MIKIENLSVGSKVVVNNKVRKGDTSVGLEFFRSAPVVSNVFNTTLIPPGEILTIVALPKKRNGVNLIDFSYKNQVFTCFWLFFKLKTNHI